MPTQSMPEVAFDQQMQTVGLRLGWMKSHVCPCTQGGRVPGTADSGCNACHGRGVYWDQPLEFLGTLTFMHTSSAPDEPGGKVDMHAGSVERSEPALTIPRSGNLNEAIVWQTAAEWDAFLEYDAVNRQNIVLLAQEGEPMVLPYQDNVTVSAVTTWDPTAKVVNTLTSSQYSVTNGVLTAPGFPDGTAFTVDFTTVPVYVAFRSAGGMPHDRPFAQGRTGIPKRFHIVALDAWLRAGGINDGPNGAGAITLR